MVEHEIDVEVVPVQGEPLLSCDKRKSLPISRRNAGGCRSAPPQERFRPAWGFGNPKEFHDHRVLKNIGEYLHLVSFLWPSFINPFSSLLKANRS